MDYDEYNYDYGEEEEEAEDEKIDYDLEDIMVETPPVTFNRLKSQSSMMFLRLDDIKTILDRRIKELQELLDATYDEILILFHYFHWNRDKLENSDWFTNQEEISRKAGLIPLDNNIPSDPNSHECPVCLGELSTEEMESLKCGHKICPYCWEAFINDNVSSKDNEFFWKCPGQNNGKNCNLIVPDSFNRKYLKKENETKYIRKLCRSYVEENKAVRWCPAPNCTYGVENPSLTSRTIRCKCSTIFCFKCGLEDHHPCSCEVASNWNSKNIQESENTKWITIYTKMCPKCNRPIEKHQGCNHMTCKHKGCDFEFCWLCLDDWKTHQGSHYKCNKYEALNQEEKDNMNSKYDKEKSDLEKYVFYFERFSNNERAFQIAKEINHKMEHNVDDLRTKLNLPFTEINFLTDATDMLQKARKILKWSYVFAYYISNHKTKDLFEFHQKDLERYCEELNEALEMNYSKSVQINQGVLDLKAFLSYKDKVSNFNYRCQKFTNEISKIIEEGTVEKI